MKKKSPVFPFRVITAWMYPSDRTECQGCKKPGRTYAINNYINMQKMIGKTLYTKLTNDAWVTAINEQACSEFPIAFTSHLCAACLNEIHIVTYGDTEKWKQALFLLSEKYGELEVCDFLLVNDYEDEGVGYWFLCPPTNGIRDVEAFVAQIEVDSHESRPTTREDIQGVIDDTIKFAKKHGKPITIIRQKRK